MTDGIMSDEELRQIGKETSHGAWPFDTQMRIYAKAIDLADRLAVVKKERSEARLFWRAKRRAAQNERDTAERERDQALAALKAEDERRLPGAAQQWADGVRHAVRVLLADETPETRARLEKDVLADQPYVVRDADGRKVTP